MTPEELIAQLLLETVHIYGNLKNLYCLLQSQALIHISAIESSKEPKITINWLDLVDKPKRGRPRKTDT